MEKLLNDFSVGLFFWQTLLFLVLMFVLRKYAWKPILNAVNERENSIQEALDSAKEAKLEMAKLKSDNEDLLTVALFGTDELLNEAREIKDRIVADAK